MKLFRAFAKDAQGQKYAGSFEAPDEPSAREMLQSEGYTEILLEEISLERKDPKFRSLKRAGQGFGDKVAQSGGSAGWARFVARFGPRSTGILKTYLACLAALGLIAGVSLVFYKPPPPDQPPEQVVGIFFDHEFSRHFSDQYDLFTDLLKTQCGSAQEYERQRQGGLAFPVPAQGPGVAPKESVSPSRSEDAIPVLEGVEIREENDKEVVLDAYVREGGWEQSFRFELISQQRAWKINKFYLLKAGEAGLAGESGGPPSSGTRLSGAAEETPSRSGGGGQIKGVNRLVGKQDSTQLRSDLRQVIENARKKGRITEEEYREKLKTLQSMKLT